MTKTYCKKCKKEVDVLELFTGDICVKCYEKEYNKLSEKDRKPVFDNSLLKV